MVGITWVMPSTWTHRRGTTAMTATYRSTRGRQVCRQVVRTFCSTYNHEILKLRKMPLNNL